MKKTLLITVSLLLILAGPALAAKGGNKPPPLEDQVNENTLDIQTNSDAITTEEAARIEADADLQDQINNIQLIEGPPGADGQDGADGAPGADGADGAPGADSVAKNSVTTTALCDLYALTGNTEPDFCFQCSDGLDNNDDGLFDFPDDPWCSSARDDTEFEKYEIGDTGPAGGIVFYITPATGGLHGLEAAPQDQSESALWGCVGTLIGADGTAVGTGAQNTADIVAGCSESGIAARIADTYVLNGYDDWFLPSIDELLYLYVQKYVVGGFAADYYWSSTEINSGGVWIRLFEKYSQFVQGFKDFEGSVRAVRAF